MWLEYRLFFMYQNFKRSFESYKPKPMGKVIQIYWKTAWIQKRGTLKNKIPQKRKYLVYLLVIPVCWSEKVFYNVGSCMQRVSKSKTWMVIMQYNLHRANLKGCHPTPYLLHPPYNLRPKSTYMALELCLHRRIYKGENRTPIMTCVLKMGKKSNMDV